ncbi:MAG: response regulator [Proteobacteria bacterium]|nr:response regulator [Pseudomonadota bacterium]
MVEKIKVLMVDDEAQFRASTSKLLTRKGFDTTIAASGEEAIQILRKEPQDVVVLDIKMPGIDGHEALKQIKKIRPETQVIMLTGHGTTDSAKATLDFGAYDYLNKPCDIDILALKINDAYKFMFKDVERAEKTAEDIMIHIEDYTTISADSTVKEAIQQLMRSFESLISTGRVMETGHRSILVFDKSNELIGIVSILDLIESLRPAYLSAPKPSMADSMQYSSMFWTGLFTAQAKVLAQKKISEVMAPSPKRMDVNSNLMEVADFMFCENIRRLLITRSGKVVGVIREQELFFELANIIL